MRYACHCQDWLENIDAVNAPITLSYIRTGHQWTGKVFRFCPWCGSPLMAQPEPADSASDAPT